TDSAGRIEGIGSRFFTVLNSGARPENLATSRPVTFGKRSAIDAVSASNATVRVRTGFDLSKPFATIDAGDRRDRQIKLGQLDRLEVTLDGRVTGAYLVANDELRDMPIGAAFDTNTNTFTWTPPVGYFGTYRLAFIADGARIDLNVVVRPPAE